MVRPIIINRELIDGRTIWKGQRVVTYQTSINPPGIPMPGMQQPNEAGKMVSSDYDHFDPTMVGLVAALDRLIFYHDILVRDNDADQAIFKAGIQTLLIWGTELRSTTNAWREPGTRPSLSSTDSGS